MRPITNYFANLLQHTRANMYTTTETTNGPWLPA
jgi:hypothetical protein